MLLSNSDLKRIMANEKFSRSSWQFLSILPTLSASYDFVNYFLFNYTCYTSSLQISRRLPMFWVRRNSISLQWIKENRHFLLPPVCRPAREQKTTLAMAFFFLAVAFMLEDSHPQGGAFTTVENGHKKLMESSRRLLSFSDTFFTPWPSFAFFSPKLA